MLMNAGSHGVASCGDHDSGDIPHRGADLVRRRVTDVTSGGEGRTRVARRPQHAAPTASGDAASAQSTAPNERPAVRRQAALASAQRKRRGGLVVLGLGLVSIAVLGFLFVLQGVDQRSPYLVTVKNIERWEVATPSHFAVVNANLDIAAGAPPEQLADIVGRVSTGRLPAGSVVQAAMFEGIPLSGDDASDAVLIQLSLPMTEAPYGTLATGDRIALIGVETADAAGQLAAVGDAIAPAEPRSPSVIGVMTLEHVEDESIYYVLPPQNALEIKQTVDRYLRSTDRLILKIGTDVTEEELTDAVARLYLGGESTGIAPNDAGGTPGAAGP